MLQEFRTPPKRCFLTHKKKKKREKICTKKDAEAYQNQVKHLRRSFLRFHLCQISFLIKLQADTCNFIKKETLVQVKRKTFLQRCLTRFSILPRYMYQSQCKSDSSCSSSPKELKTSISHFLNANIMYN